MPPLTPGRIIALLVLIVAIVAALGVAGAQSGAVAFVLIAALAIALLLS